MIMCEFAAEKRSFCLQRPVFLQRLLNLDGFMKIQYAQYLPVSVEVGQVHTEKYARLVQAFVLPMYFNENFYTLRFYASL